MRILIAAVLVLAGCDRNKSWTDATWHGAPVLADQAYANGHPLVVNGAQSAETAAIEDRLAVLFNLWREAHGLPAWSRDLALDGLARGYAAHMPIERFIGNTDPEGDFFFDRAFRASGKVVYGQWREMLALGPSTMTADTLMVAWGGSGGDLVTLGATDVNAFGVGAWVADGELWVAVELLTR